MNRSRSQVDVGDLLCQLQEAGGVLRVENPDDTVRAAYRRAISAAITSGQLPAGAVLRHTGRDRGDLVIRLTPADDEPRPAKPAPIDVPASLDDPHWVVGQLAERADFAVSAEVKTAGAVATTWSFE